MRNHAIHNHFPLLPIWPQQSLWNRILKKCHIGHRLARNKDIRKQNLCKKSLPLLLPLLPLLNSQWLLQKIKEHFKCKPLEWKTSIVISEFSSPYSFEPWRSKEYLDSIFSCSTFKVFKVAIFNLQLCRRLKWLSFDRFSVIILEYLHFMH